MKIHLLLFALFAAGCTSAEVEKKRGEARIALFRECMELAAKNYRSADDDVADVIHSCANNSAYMTNYIK